MTLPASGTISLSMVNTELNLSATAPISLNDAAVRTLFGVPSGAISMSNGHGKSNAVMLYVADHDLYQDGVEIYRGWAGTGYPHAATVTPSTFRGCTIEALYAYIYPSGQFNSFHFGLSGNLPKSFFTSFTLNGLTYTSAASTHGVGPTVTYWQWSVNPNLTVGVTYPVVIT